LRTTVNLAGDPNVEVWAQADRLRAGGDRAGVSLATCMSGIDDLTDLAPTTGVEGGYGGAARARRARRGGGQFEELGWDLLVEAMRSDRPGWHWAGPVAEFSVKGPRM